MQEHLTGRRGRALLRPLETFLRKNILRGGGEETCYDILKHLCKNILRGGVEELCYENLKHLCKRVLMGGEEEL